MLSQTAVLEILYYFIKTLMKAPLLVKTVNTIVKVVKKINNTIFVFNKNINMIKRNIYLQIDINRFTF